MIGSSKSSEGPYLIRQIWVGHDNDFDRGDTDVGHYNVNPYLVHFTYSYCPGANRAVGRRIR
jgi:hypothetical protein